MICDDYAYEKCEKLIDEILNFCLENLHFVKKGIY